MLKKKIIIFFISTILIFMAITTYAKEEKIKRIIATEISTPKEKKYIEKSLDYKVRDVKYIEEPISEINIKKSNKNSKYKIRDIIGPMRVTIFSEKVSYSDRIENKSLGKVKSKNAVAQIFSNTYNTSVFIDSDIISETLGFNVNEEINVESPYEIELEKNEIAILNTYKRVDHYEFNIEKDGKIIGHGEANKVVGISVVRK